jgi:hypothetical protein
VRLAIVESPPIERTVWKEIDYVMISENYWRNGYQFFWPELSWPAEEPRATAMEFPLVPFAAALGYALVGETALSVRWPTLVAFVLLGVVVFRLMLPEFGALAALASAAAALFMTVPHEFGTILYSDPWAILLASVTVLVFGNWLRNRATSTAILATLSLALALALKIETLYIAPCLAWLVWRREGFALRGYAAPAAVCLIALALGLSWYAYAHWLARNSFDAFGVFGGLDGGHDKFQTLTMLTDRHWYVVMWERLSWGLLGGKVGIVLVVTGLGAGILTRSVGLVVAYLIAVLCYFALVAEGQIDGPYRQLHAVPPLAALTGLGATALLAAAFAVAGRLVPAVRRNRTVFFAFALFAAVVISVGPSARRIYLATELAAGASALSPKWTLAQKIREIAGDDSLLVTVGEYSLHRGDVDLSPVLYWYARARGWSLVGTRWTISELETLRRKGASLLVGVGLAREPLARARLEELVERFPVLYRDVDSLILDLRRPLPEWEKLRGQSAFAIRCPDDRGADVSRSRPASPDSSTR